MHYLRKAYILKNIVFNLWFDDEKNYLVITFLGFHYLICTIIIFLDETIIQTLSNKNDSSKMFVLVD